MNKKFLELDERQATFFEYSKEQKDGFEKHESENGKISFRKYHKKGIKGVLKYINEREEEFKNGKVKKLSLVVDNGDDRFYVNFNIMTAKGNMNQFVEQLIPFLPNMKQGESYRIFPYEMESEYVNAQGETKTAKNRGVSVHTWDVPNDVKLLKVERAHSFAKDGDIPGINWEKVEDMGVVKNIKDDRNRRNFLYKVLQASVTTSSPEGSTQASQPTQQTPAATASPATQAVVSMSTPEEDHDDLPF